MNRWINRLFLIFLLYVLALPASFAQAQETQPDGPVYVVQPGDSLWSIAVRFRVSMTALAQANGISDPGQISVGARLVIPGLSGVTGVLTTSTVPPGETLESLSRRYNLARITLARLNHLTSPSELYIGTTLVLPEPNLASGKTRQANLLPGQSLLELAILNDANPWDVLLQNNVSASWGVLPSDVVFLSSEDATGASAPSPGALPPAIQSLVLNPDSLVQGKAAVIQLSAPANTRLGGSIHDRPLHFFNLADETYVSLQGLFALLEPGLYPLVLTGTLPAEAPYYGTQLAFSQAVLVQSGNYPFDPVLMVDPETIDPANTGPEDSLWRSLMEPVSPQKLWSGQFVSPAPKEFSECFPSLFGNRRSYNGSAYTYFHTGLDFCGSEGTQIFAPAAGIVVFAGPLTVRGNATVIDHGWGVYTAYLHQSQILVQVDEQVQPGQLIGLVGRTGRVTGPHLHWEIWVGGVQVDPLDWLKNTFPN